MLIVEPLNRNMDISDSVTSMAPNSTFMMERRRPFSCGSAALREEKLNTAALVINTTSRINSRYLISIIMDRQLPYQRIKNVGVAPYFIRIYLSTIVA
ncbi:hypothetical protein D3C85_1666630 [compost metagenome]